MEIKKKRVGNDLIIRLTLKDSGVAVSWSGVDILSAQMYSDAQRVMAGFCDTEIDAEDATVLLVRYGANEPQYLGVNRLVMSFIYDGATVTYDCPVVKYVSLTEEEGTETISSVSATVTASGSVDLDLEVDALTAYIKPEGGIPESDLAQAVKDKLNRSSSAATWGSITGTLASQTDLNTELGKKYAKPSGGIPENDLAQAVKTKLNAGGTFTVSIRETPYADILAAINAGKIPVTDELADRYVFGGLSGSVIYFFQADPDSLFFVTVDEDDEWLDGELPLTGLYVKPGTGIPESDLAQAVKNKLAGGAGAVRYDVSQSLQLSDTEKATARQNINAERLWKEKEVNVSTTTHRLEVEISEDYNEFIADVYVVYGVSSANYLWIGQGVNPGGDNTKAIARPQISANAVAFHYVFSAKSIGEYTITSGAYGNGASLATIAMYSAHSWGGKKTGNNLIFTLGNSATPYIGAGSFVKIKYR